MTDTCRKLVPGLILVAVLAVAARLVSSTLAAAPDVVVALIFGVALNNVGAVPVSCADGITFTHRYLLRLAIIILGASVSFGTIVQTGGATLAIIVACVGIAFLLSLSLARLVKLPSRVGTLLGSATAICGATAVITVGPIIAAEQIEMAYAIGTIFAYNAIAVVVYPLVGHWLHLSDVTFGTWAGTAVNDTSAVVATGYAYSNEAGQTAVIVKLIRTALLVPLALAVGITYGLRRSTSGGERVSIWKMMPWFIFGFLAMAALNTAGALPADAARLLTDSGKFLIVMVLAAVGATMSAAEMRRIGIKPLLVGLFVGSALGIASLAIIRLAGIG